MTAIIDFKALAKELDTFVRRAVVSHTYVGEKEQTWLATIIGALQDAHRYRWQHIDDALPALDTWVLCAGYGQRRNGEVYEWSGCGKRKSRHGGAWEWQFDDEDFDGEDLEFWCAIRDLPSARHFKPKAVKPPPEEDVTKDGSGSPV